MKLDIIGDIHGCYFELKQLTIELGYDWSKEGYPVHKDNRKLAFIGDLADRGPHSIKTLQLVCRLVKNELAFYVPGNHCNKLYRYFLGNNVQITHGLETTVQEFTQLDDQQKQAVRKDFIMLYENSPLYHVLDNGQLILAHAGIKQELIGLNNKKVKTFVLYGDINGKTHEDGSPIRADWAVDYKGEAIIVYGHTPVKEVRIINKTFNIDTGAVFGNKLSALRYPELEVVSVPSSMPYVEEKFRSF
ncbi:bis(5'-nucleosyl)-tetraphosphatase PrpE [Bacillus sp. CRN 9]|nr:bis(5'-nucleosyl)-tetraphosphatase PrpE [Bacillus sp. CRN 9]